MCGGHARKRGSVSNDPLPTATSHATRTLVVVADNLPAEVGGLAALHELVEVVDVAHVLQEACKSNQTVPARNENRSVRTEGEVGLDEVLGIEPRNGSLVELPDLVGSDGATSTEVLLKCQTSGKP